MTALFGGGGKRDVFVPTPVSAAPTPSSVATSNAGQAVAAAQGAGMGQASTVLTSGLGDLSNPTLAKKILLGA